VEEITTEAELRQLLGEPLPRVAAKDLPALDEIDRQWLAARIAQVQDRPDELLADLERYYGEQQAAALYPRS
jgi:hypothetical protein